MRTKAAVLFELSEPLRIVEVDIPALKPGQVLVDVAYSGVCRSQLLEIRGKRGPDQYLPHTLGHEGSGTVLAVGDDVTKVKPGDRVVLSWIKGIGADVPSTIYGSEYGPVNSGAISTFMQQTVTCENRVTPIPQEMPLREAALLGCAVPTGAGIVLNTAKVEAGSSMAVFGLGGVGLSAVLAGAMLKAGMIIAVDVVDEKLDLAVRIGATHKINASREDPVEVIRKITGARGADYSIEAAGKPVTMEAAFQSVRDNGGLCVIAGNVAHGSRIAIDPFDLIRGKCIIGTWGGETQTDRDVPVYVKKFLTGDLHLAPIITSECALPAVNILLDDLNRGRIMGRALVSMSPL